jgi:hypothetical protein
MVELMLRDAMEYTIMFMYNVVFFSKMLSVKAS